jgi:GMP synthase-like glutamine amidotransferase
MILLVDNASQDDNPRMTPLLVDECRRAGHGLYVHPGHVPDIPEAILREASCIVVGGSDRHACDDHTDQDATGRAIVHALAGNVALLGICYGMHRLAQHLGCRVYTGMPRSGVYEVHVPVPATRPLNLSFECSDFVSNVPHGFESLLQELPHGIVLMSNGASGGRATGAAFHPEATADGRRLLRLWLQGATDLLVQ